jgi:sporulation protein YlmC with PRC-barrel domain
MLKPILLGATALLLAAGPTFAADCDAELAAVDKKIAASENARVAFGGLSREVRQLRDAAQILARHGQSGACEEVAEAIDKIVQAQAKPGSAAGASYDKWSADERTRIGAAIPVSKLTTPVRADELAGADVRNAENKTLGEIDDVVLDPRSGGVSYVVISHGGFLGLGEKQVLAPWTALQTTEKRDVFVLNMSEEELKAAPSFKRGDWRALADERWLEANRAYYARYEK